MILEDSLPYPEDFTEIEGPPISDDGDVLVDASDIRLARDWAYLASKSPVGDYSSN